MEHIARGSLYNRGAVLLSVQRWLGTCWVTIASSGEDWLVSFRPKTEGEVAPTADEYGNALVEAAFLEQRARETLSLRQTLLSRALSPYPPELSTPLAGEP